MRETEREKEREIEKDRGMELCSSNIIVVVNPFKNSHYKLPLFNGSRSAPHVR